MIDFWVPRSSFHYRSELPSHASWSNDTSLIAVAAGSFVPIYDSTTNALLQVLVASECGRVTSVHFLGSSGRFLAVAGERDLVLWDLVSHTSMYPLSSMLILHLCGCKSTMALPFWSPYWPTRRSPFRGQIGVTPIAQERQLGPTGDSCTPLPTWFGRPIPYMFYTVRDSKRDVVLAR